MKKFKDIDKTTWVAIGGALVSAIAAFAGAMGEHKKEVAINERFEAHEKRFAELEKREEA